MNWLCHTLAASAAALHLLTFARLRVVAVYVVIALLGATGVCQEPTPTPEADVVKIEAPLAQTSVTVTDKKGRPVDGLRKEDFSLIVEGKPVPIEFFERVVTGSTRDKHLLSRDKGFPVSSFNAGSSGSTRTIIFFVDDHHMSLTGIERTRAALSEFIDKRMGPDDQVAIASPSGRVGFLQQFTDNKDVLRAAVRRLGVVALAATDYGSKPGAPMTEYNALSIERRDDPGVFNFYVQSCIVSAPIGVDGRQQRAMKEACEVEVRNRARQVVIQAGAITDGTYSAFEKLLESAERMSGRKLAFFLSDGFLAETGPRGRVSQSRIGEITAQARRASVVVYTIDTRGLVNGSLDATGASAFDPDGRLESAQLRAIAASQDALHAIASDTGGRALRNQSSFDVFITDAIDETSSFYLLAWRPEEGVERKQKLRNVEITIPTRTELTILAGSNVVSTSTQTSARSTTKTDPKKAPAENADLKAALADYFGGGELPVFLSLNYVDAPATGPLLTTSIEIPAGSLSFGAQGKERGQVTVAGVILDDRGKPAASFGTGLKVAPRSTATVDASKIVYNHPNPIKPGLFQVRLAVRDDRSELVGSANGWILIPNLASHDLELSSIFIAGASSKPGSIEWSVDKTFRANDALNILAFVYNARATGQAGPDIETRLAIYRGRQEVSGLPFEKVTPEASTDSERLSVSRRIRLDGLAPGKYILTLTARDRTNKKEVARNIGFTIE